MFWSRQTALPDHWKRLDDRVQVEHLIERSQTQPILIFKHSTRCSISAFALNRLIEGNEALKLRMEVHYLDLLQFRGLSNSIAEKLKVHHQSPQAILLSNGEVIGSCSHELVEPNHLLGFLKV